MTARSATAAVGSPTSQGWVQIEFPEKVRINKIVWSRDREGAYTDRLPTSYMIEAGADPNLMRRVAGRPALRPAVNPRLNVERFQPVTAKFLRFTILATTSLEPCLDELEVFTADENSRNVALATNGARATASGTYPNSELHRLEHLNDGKVGNSRSWISNEPGRGWVQVEFPEPVRINKVLWSRDREEKFADRLATNYTIEIAMTSTIGSGSPARMTARPILPPANKNQSFHRLG